MLRASPEIPIPDDPAVIFPPAYRSAQLLISLVGSLHYYRVHIGREIELLRNVQPERFSLEDSYAATSSSPLLDLIDELQMEYGRNVDELAGALTPTCVL